MEATDEHEITFVFGVLSSGVGIGLRQHPGDSEGSFSPARTGLDHVSLAVGSRTQLEEWERHFADKRVDHSAIVDAPYGAVLSFKDPDGIALEAFALAG